MNRAPLTRQRSPWVGVPDMTTNFDGYVAHWFHRRVGDGLLWACVGEEPIGWHLSISFRDQRDQLTRYPTWDEIAHARDELLPDDVDFVMHLPTADEYVALHDTCFHIHEHPERSVLA
jgi:hypothetical protein